MIKTKILRGAGNVDRMEGRNALKILTGRPAKKCLYQGLGAEWWAILE